MLGLKMNKMMGFFELSASDLPTINWNLYTPDVQLDEKYLWTIRSAVKDGDDLNLPRSIGKNAKDSMIFADKLYDKIGSNGMVIYYPYFVAHKSGTLCVDKDNIVIEAVDKDLWNMVTKNDVDVSMTFDSKGNLISSNGNNNFLEEEEILLLLKNAVKVKALYWSEIHSNSTVLLEWSLASNCTADGSVDENKYLVFYEARTI